MDDAVGLHVNGLWKPLMVVSAGCVTWMGNFTVRGLQKEMHRSLSGTAADMIKLAMIKIHETFKKTCSNQKCFSSA
jgi:hypothetical protein